MSRYNLSRRIPNSRRAIDSNQVTSAKKIQTNKFYLLKIGDIVGFKDEATKEVVDTGVVFKVWDKGIQVALSQPNETETFETAKYSLVHLANEVTYPFEFLSFKMWKCFPSLFKLSKNG